MSKYTVAPSIRVQEEICVKMNQIKSRREKELTQFKITKSQDWTIYQTQTQNSDRRYITLYLCDAVLYVF